MSTAACVLNVSVHVSRTLRVVMSSVLYCRHRFWKKNKNTNIWMDYSCHYFKYLGSTPCDASAADKKEDDEGNRKQAERKPITGLQCSPEFTGSEAAGAHVDQKLFPELWRNKDELGVISVPSFTKLVVKGARAHCQSFFFFFYKGGKNFDLAEGQIEATPAHWSVLEWITKRLFEGLLGCRGLTR